VQGWNVTTMINDYPKDLCYTPAHLWVRRESGRKRIARVGLTEELASRLKSLLGVDLPMVGDELEMDSPCIHIHRQSNIFSLPAPLSGRVTQINKDVLDTPSLLALEPYKHWLFLMEFDEEEEIEMLMNAHQYASHLDNL
jgi:glycine cleavage system H protein